MIAGINGSEALVLLVIILIVVGPERLPRYAAQLGRFVRGVKTALSDAQEKVRDEMGAEGEEIPWEKLDPRQYDPRHIMRDALTSEDGAGGVASGGAAGGSGSAAMGAGAVGAGAAGGALAFQAYKREEGVPPPFDDEAT